jgi:hypothetical protein
MRYDGKKYRDCRWCRGSGCVYCESEADKDYKAAFPDEPKPIATFRLDTPEGAESARRALGIEALQKAFGAGGGGMAEFMENLEREGKS